MHDLYSLIANWQDSEDLSSKLSIYKYYYHLFGLNETTLYRGLNLDNEKYLPKIGDKWIFVDDVESFTEDFDMTDSFCERDNQCNLWLKEHARYYNEKIPVVLVLPEGVGISCPIHYEGLLDYEHEREHLVEDGNFTVVQVSWVDTGIDENHNYRDDTIEFIQTGYYKIILGK